MRRLHSEEPQQKLQLISTCVAALLTLSSITLSDLILLLFFLAHILVRHNKVHHLDVTIDVLALLSFSIRVLYVFSSALCILVVSASSVFFFLARLTSLAVRVSATPRIF